MSANQQLLVGVNAGPVRGEQVYTTAGTYSWVAPAGVTKVSILAIGSGGRGGGSGIEVYCCACFYYSGGGGGGGGLAYLNNYTVVPGNSYTVVVAAPNLCTNCHVPSYFVSTSTVGAGAGRAAGGLPSYAGDGGSGLGTTATKYSGDRGGYGNYTCSGAAPKTGAGGGGAAGYSGQGGHGGEYCGSGTSGSGGGGGGGAGGGTGTLYNGSGGGGTGYSGVGTSGSGGSARSGGGGGSGGLNGENASTSVAAAGGNYGGGGGGGSLSSGARGSGGNAAIRIIWPGCARSFPSTDVA